MKRWLILIVALLLAGCANQQEAATEPTDTAAVSATEPTGYYDPSSALEASTDGAVRVYPLNRSDSYGLVPMGGDLLLLSGEEVTTLTKLSGSNLYVSAAANLGCYIPADSPSFRVSEKGITYYDELHRELVFLDSGLKEVSRVSLPETIVGTPALSTDRKALYYCTADAIRVIDLDTNLDRFLRQTSHVSQTLVGLHCSNTILECTATDDYGKASTLFISPGTGETLYETTDEISLWTVGTYYFAIHYEGAYRELLSGTADSAPGLLVADDYDAAASPIPEMTGVVLVSRGEESTTVLNYYDLQTGTRAYTLSLPGEETPWGIRGDADDGCIWYLRYDETYGSDILCRWELEGTASGDESVWLTTRYTAENPDTESIAACKATASAIGKKHGVEILLWTDAASGVPEHYSLEEEYQAPLLGRYLELLDEALSSYPSGFLTEAASGNTVRISLVRSITGNSDAQEPGSIRSLHFWDDSGVSNIILTVGGEMVPGLHNELFHVIGSRVMSISSAFDDWEELNPDGFEYHYLPFAMEYDPALLEGESRAFVSEQAMVSPLEDRAAILEYAMTPGNEDLFTSAIVQAKLRQLCLGIREAFGLEDPEEAFLWEQYLSEAQE